MRPIYFMQSTSKGHALEVANRSDCGVVLTNQSYNSKSELRSKILELLSLGTDVIYEPLAFLLTFAACSLKKTNQSLFGTTAYEMNRIAGNRPSLEFIERWIDFQVSLGLVNILLPYRVMYSLGQLRQELQLIEESYELLSRRHPEHKAIPILCFSESLLVGYDSAQRFADLLIPNLPGNDLLLLPLHSRSYVRTKANPKYLAGLAVLLKLCQLQKINVLSLNTGIHALLLSAYTGQTQCAAPADMRFSNICEQRWKLRPSRKRDETKEFHPSSLKRVFLPDLLALIKPVKYLQLRTLGMGAMLGKTSFLFDEPNEYAPFYEALEMLFACRVLSGIGLSAFESILEDAIKKVNELHSLGMPTGDLVTDHHEDWMTTVSIIRQMQVGEDLLASTW